MKYRAFLSLLLLFCSGFFSIARAQAPHKMSYQSVIRDAGGNLVLNSPVSVRISIRQGSPSGTVLFSETHSATTNGNGLLSLIIGEGVQLSNNPLDSVDWSFGPYYMDSETDPTGGTNYSVVGTTRMLSVPYAMWAANGPTGPQGPQGPQGPPGSPGLGVYCTGNATQYATIRADGSGAWECTDVLRVRGTGTTENVAINALPNTSFDLLVNRNIGIGWSPNSSYELSVDGQAYIDENAGIGTTPSTSWDLAVGNGGLGVGNYPNSSYEFSVDGDAHVDDGLSVGTSSSAWSGVKSVAYNLTSSSSGTGTYVVRNSSGDLVPESSTRNIKDDITDLEVNKAKLLGLRPVSYRLKPALGGEADIGLIAEEVEELLPELVVYGPKRQWIGDTGLVEHNEDGTEVLSETETEPYSVKYGRIGVMLIPVVREQEETIQQQQAEIEALKARLDALEARLSE